MIENCPPCSGSGKLDTDNTKQAHLCPWCNGSGRTSIEVCQAYYRVAKLLPNYARTYKVFGTVGMKTSAH